MQFTATEEYVRLVEEAKALLSHAAPGMALEELHLRAMRALVSTLKKRKYATKDEVVVREKSLKAHATKEEVVVSEKSPKAQAPSDSPPKVMPAHPRQRGRHVPAAVRRAVFERNGGSEEPRAPISLI